jgi:hypothetical protein
MRSQGRRPFVAGLGSVVADVGASSLSAQWLDRYDEGVTRYYETRFGFPEDGDLSVSHIPWSVRFTKRVALNPASTQELAGLLGQAAISTPSVRCRLHIFPYGVVNLLTTISVEVPSAIANERIGNAARWIGGRGGTRGAGPSVGILGSEFRASLPDLEEYVQSRVAHSLFPAPGGVLVKTGQFLSLHVEAPLSEADAPQLFARLTGEAQPGRLRGDLRSGQSVFGKYKTDRVLIAGSTMVVATGAEISRHHDRRFFWKLISVVELATNQRVVFDNTINLLQSYQMKTIGEAKDVSLLQHVVKISNHLLGVHKHMASPYRKWYYEVSEELGLDHHREDVEALTKKVSNKSKDESMARYTIQMKESNGYYRLESHRFRLAGTPTKITVLFLAADPVGLARLRLRLDEEHRLIRERIRATDHREAISLESWWAVRPGDLLDALNRHKPQVLHVSGHSTDQHDLVLQDANGRTRFVSKEDIASTLGTLGGQVRVVVFNSCFSEGQAEAVTRHVDVAIGLKETVGDEAARVFAGQFYSAIGYGLSVRKAFDQALVQLRLEGVGEDRKFELHTRTGIDPDAIVLVRPDNVPGV